MKAAVGQAKEGSFMNGRGAQIGGPAGGGQRGGVL